MECGVNSRLSVGEKGEKKFVKISEDLRTKSSRTRLDIFDGRMYRAA